MKQQFTAVCVGICLMVVAAPPSGIGKTEQPNIRLLQTGEIVKVDIKKRILKVRDPLVESSAEGVVGHSPTQSGRKAPGRAGGKSRPRMWPGSANEPGVSSQFEVSVTDETVIRSGGNPIEFGTLHDGERVLVKGLPRDNKGNLQATEITVLSQS